MVRNALIHGEGSHRRPEPLVTAIIPTYNRASVVGDAIESVRRQTYRNVEIVVVDDGSTDDTQTKLRTYGDTVRVIVQENAGPAVARNRGLEVARGEIVAWLDSDDVWKPTKLERQVRLLQRLGDSVPCCLCNAVMVFPDGREQATFDYTHLTPLCEEGIWENVVEIYATRFVPFAQTAAIRREVVERIGGFDETLRYQEDHEYPLRLALEGAWGFIREPLVLWRQESPGSYTVTAHANELIFKQCGFQMWRGLYERVCASDKHRHLRRLFLRRLKESRRQLLAAHLRGRADWPGSILARSALRVERYRRALHRRYPRMKIAPLVAMAHN